MGGPPAKHGLVGVVGVTTIVENCVEGSTAGGGDVADVTALPDGRVRGI